MKKILSLIIALALVLSLAGCTQRVEKEETATETTTETATTETTETNEEATETEEATESTDTPVEEVSTMETTIVAPVEIEFWHAMNGHHQEVLEALTAKFNEENGMGITVKLVNQGGYGDLSKKLMAGVASGEFPDMAQVYDNWIINYLEKVVVLDDYIANSEIGLSDFEDIVASYREENHEFGAYYTMPFNKSTYIYFYNKTLLNELGMEVPTTWEELYDVSKAAYEKTGNAALGYDDLTGMFQSFVLQNGGEFITQNGEVKFTDEKGVEALKFFFDMYEEGVARIAGEDVYHSGPFSNGDLFAYVGSSAGLAYINPNGFELGVAALQSNVAAAAPQAGTNLAMFAEETDNQLAVWEYMKYLTSVEATTEWAMETGYLPVRISAYESETFQAYLADSEAMQAAYSQVNAFYYEPTFDGSYSARSAITTAIETALLEGTDVETAVTNIAEAVEAETK